MRLELFESDRLNFVEFNTTGDTELYLRCDSESKFMDTIAFNLFSECFENANKLYEYFTPTRYTVRNIVVLLNELNIITAKWSVIKTKQDFIDRLLVLYMGRLFLSKLESDDPELNHWEDVFENLKKITQELTTMVSMCIEEERVLWVIGY